MHKVWQEQGMSYNKKQDFIHELLKVRGVKDPVEFLNITKKKLHNPYKMKDMKRAVTRIIKAIENGERIGIFGDYDADGVSSTSLWLLTLRELGADVVYFIPDRHKDGYGVGKRGVQFMKDEGVDLVITCDTGITAIDPVRDMKDYGIDVIVTDHHEPQQSESYEADVVRKGILVDGYLLPDCDAVVNIKRPDCKYPFKSLAGVGVSFKILCAVCEKVHPAKRAGVYQFIDIVALGTFADMMDIVDENRVIGSLGLDMMSNTKNKGLYQLLRANKLHEKQLTSMDIGWTIAPCINAAGRIVSAEQAVDMIVSDNKLDAYRSAKKLVEINEERKELTKAYVGNIIKAIELEQEDNPTAIIIHYHPGVPEGIVGLIAGRLMNHFYKPCILLTDSDDKKYIKGSGRSISALNLFETLMLYTDRIQFGGHHMACGMTIEKDGYVEFKQSIEFYVDTVLSDSDLQPKIFIDCIVTGDTVDMDFVKEVQRLEPFGNGNHKPLFMMKKLNIIKQKPVGDEKNHFWALLSDGKKTFSAIGFFLYDKYEALGSPKKIDVAFFPDINEYPAGKFNVQLKLEDLRKA